MATYIIQGRFSSESIKAMAKNPDDRREAASAMMSGAGFTLKEYFVTLGDHDFLVIAEGPDASGDALTPLVVAAASGAVTDLKTTIAFSTADLKSACEKASAQLAKYRRPGA